MPQGVVISVGPPLTDRKCKGEIIALKNDSSIGVKKGVIYEFKSDSEICCKKEAGDFADIVGKEKDGSVRIECYADKSEEK